MRLSTRWAFLTLIPASLASGDGPPPWQPPPIHSAADLPAAMAAALGDVCRFEPMFTGGLGGCKCKPDPDPTHLIPRPQCDPPPEPGSPAFDRLERLARDSPAAFAHEDSSPSAMELLWHLIWSSEGMPGVAWPDWRVDSSSSTQGDGALDVSSIGPWLLENGVRLQDPVRIVAALDRIEYGLLKEGKTDLGERNRQLALQALGLRSANAVPLRHERAPSTSRLEEGAWSLARSDERPGTTKACEFLQSRGVEVSGANTDLATRLVESSPQRAREIGVFVVPACWSESLNGDRPGDAMAWVRFLGYLGSKLECRSGELSVGRVASDILCANGSARHKLARGFASLFRGWWLYERFMAGASRREYLGAERALSETSKEGAEWARVGLAGADLSSSRGAEAEAELLGVFNRNRGKSALAGRALWGLGLRESRMNRLMSSERMLEDAAMTFAALGEEENEVGVLSLLSEVLSRSGDLRRSWATRVRGFCLTGAKSQSEWRDMMIADAASAALAENMPWASVRFYDLLLESEFTNGDPVAKSFALVGRATALGAMGEVARSKLDLQSAADEASLVASKILRDRIGLEILLGRGRIEPGLLSSRDAAAAVRLASSLALDDYGIAARRLDASIALREGNSSRASRSLRAALNLADRALSRTGDPSVGRKIIESRQGILDGMVASIGSGGEKPMTILNWLETEALVFEVYSQGEHSRRVRRELPWRRWASALKLGEVVIRFGVFENCTLSWVFTRAGVGSCTFPFGSAQVASMVAASLDSLRAGRDILAPDPIRSLLKDVARRSGVPFPKAGRLVIVGDRALQDLPFAFLESPSGPGIALNHFDIERAPSAEWYFSRKADLGISRGVRAGSTWPPCVVVLGALGRLESRPELSTLRAGSREIEGIRRAYGQVTVLEPARDSLRAVLQSVHRSDILHIASHAELDRKLASDSKVLFPLSDPDRGFGAIAVGDLVGDHQTGGPRVLVLTSCGSALSGQSRFDSYSALNTSLVGGGLEAIVGTLWEVDDEIASDLSIAFHQGLSRRLDAVSALRQAQLGMLTTRGRERAVRATAAAFVVLGNSKLTFSEENTDGHVLSVN